MSQSSWYHDKAAKCDRMALASTDAASRARHIKERDNWREIAARIDEADEAAKQKKRITRPPFLWTAHRSHLCGTDCLRRESGVSDRHGRARRADLGFNLGV